MTTFLRSPLVALWVAVATTSVPASPSAAAGPAEQSCSTYFATVRDLVQTTDLDSQFGAGRGQLTFGRAHLSFSEGRGGRINASPVLSREEFSRRIGREAKQHGGTVTLFVHGYANTWSSAIKGASYVHLASKIEGPLVVFSWPSSGSFTGYLSDRADLEWSYVYIATSLKLLLEAEGVERVNIVAHSLGALGIVRAIAEVARYDAVIPLKIQHIVFAAPDVEYSVMDEEFLPIAKRFNLSVTVYASDGDFGIYITSFLSDQPKVGGIQNGIYLRPGVETVDVSLIDSSFFRHSAIYSSVELFRDLAQVLNGVPAAERRGLVPIDLAAGRYWRIAPPAH